MALLRSKEVVEERLVGGIGLLGLLGVLLLQALLFDCIKEYMVNSYVEEKRKGRTDLLPAQGLGVGVETEENGLVDEGVLLLGPGALLNFLASGADDGLDFVTVDETSDIGVRDLGGGEAGNPREERTKKISIAPTSNLSCRPKPCRRYQRLHQEERKHPQSR